MSEHQEQKALFEWVERVSNLWPELRLMFAVPNGGARSKATAGRLKAEGVKAGVPDVILPIPRGGYGACYIELKVPAQNGKKAGRESKAQKAMREALCEAGNYSVVCVGWDAASVALIKYLRGEAKL